MERGFIYLLKLIDYQQHTQHEFHQAKLKLSTEWIPDWQKFLTLTPIN